LYAQGDGKHKLVGIIRLGKTQKLKHAMLILLCSMHECTLSIDIWVELQLVYKVTLKCYK